MIIFVIPMRSKHASKNWDLVQKLFNRTLRSVYGQTDPEFKVLVGVHDMPELEDTYDGRVEFIKMSYPVPMDTKEQMYDKYYKKRILMKRVAELGGGYTMFVDDDDVISNKIAAYVKVDQHPYGYYVKTGYDHFYWPNKLKVSFKFHGVCGTCCIVNYGMEDLPGPDLNYEGYKLEERSLDYLFDYNHRKWVPRMEELGRSLKPLPFKAAIATLNTSENYSQNFKGFTKRDLMRKFLPGFRPTERIKNEFTIKD